MPEEEQIRLLREIARWTREAALPGAKARVDRLVDTEPKKRVYEAIAAGTETVTAVEKATGVNHNDINSWLKVWQERGIVESGLSPPKALFTLDELGIPPASPRAPKKKQAGT